VGGASAGAEVARRGGVLGDYLTRRSLHSLVSLLGLIILVFFLARLTGDPTNLYLPLDASLEARAEFAEKHGFTDPLLVQFGRFLGDRTKHAIVASRASAEVLRVSQSYTAAIKQSGGWWIGWIEEVPGVHCQERTREELLEMLRITLKEALDLNRRETRAAAGDGFEEIPIVV
jgi:predicted RNase H-like HicB family nuclease